MLCPECKQNAFEPEYYEKLNAYISDIPYIRETMPRTIKVLHHFRCSHCDAIYYPMGGETTEQAYWRIIRDYAKD